MDLDSSYGINGQARGKDFDTMQFSLIHENKLKVILTTEDMQELGLSYEEMDYSDSATREALLEVLNCARSQVHFNPRRQKLFIEIYPCEGGGCVLYFTCLHTDRGGQAGMRPVIFEFENAGELAAAAQGAYRQYRQRIYRSALYRLEEHYRLLVWPLDYTDRLSIYFLSEYGRCVGEGALLAAYTDEHGEEILAENAIETLAEQFRQKD